MGGEHDRPAGVPKGSGEGGERRIEVVQVDEVRPEPFDLLPDRLLHAGGIGNVPEGAGGSLAGEDHGAGIGRGHFRRPVHDLEEPLLDPPGGEPRGHGPDIGLSAPGGPIVAVDPEDPHGDAQAARMARSDR